MEIARSSLRLLARFAFRQTHRLLARAFSETELCQDAAVFSPHPDDETLGCGGTVILKRRRGAAIDVVFMTDGSGSHTGLIAAEELRGERQREAMAATARLGVDAQHLTWLGLPDGDLVNHHAQAVAQVADLLCQKRPAQVFVPFREHEHPDHVETYLIVREALSKAGLTIQMCEYPIWYFHQWPFVRDSSMPLRELLTTGPRAWVMGTLAPFDVRVDLTSVADCKRQALAEHNSQVSRRNGDPRWHTLGDVANGDFLNSFFEAELFSCSPIR